MRKETIYLELKVSQMVAVRFGMLCLSMCSKIRYGRPRSSNEIHIFGMTPTLSACLPLSPVLSMMFLSPTVTKTIIDRSRLLK